MFRPQRRAVSRAAIALTLVFLASATPERAAPPTLSPGARRQMDALGAIAQARTPLERKLDSALHLGLLHQRGDDRLAPLTHFRFVKPEADGRVRVDVALHGAGGLTPALDWLAANGAPIEAASAAWRIVTTRLRFEDLEPLAALPAVRQIRRHVQGRTTRWPASSPRAPRTASRRRSLYWNANGTIWAAGTNAGATRVP